MEITFLILMWAMIVYIIFTCYQSYIAVKKLKQSLQRIEGEIVTVCTIVKANNLASMIQEVTPGTINEQILKKQ